MGFLRSFRSYISRIVLSAVLLSVPAGHPAAKDFTVTLDAGHGGKDFGALGTRTNEKTINLAMVKRLGKLIESNLKDVKVVYTRDKDEYIGLDERPKIANEAASDLFISIHINSVDKRNRNRTRIQGCEVYTLGLHKTAQNLAVAKRENAVMEFDADHNERYAAFDPNSLESDIVFELSQGKRLDQSIEFADAVHSELVKVSGRAPKGVKQAGFYVLWATTMPSVLIELDYICNPDSERYLTSDKGQEAMTVAIYNAFCAYLNTYGSQVTGRRLPVAHAINIDGRTRDGEVPVLSAPVEAPAETAVYEEQTTRREQSGDNAIRQIADDSGKPQYYVQILASSDRIKPGARELKGMAGVEFYRDGGLYKYVVGVADSLEKAQKLLRRVRKDFPQSFIIKMVNGKRVDFIKP